MKKNTTIIMCLGILFWVGCASENSNRTVNLKTPGNSASINKPENPETTVAENINKPVVTDDSKKSSAAKFGGNWDSDKLNTNGNKHTGFSLFIMQVGDKIKGTYSVVDYIDGEPQIEDGNQTPFTGTVKNDTAEIKFDPDATVPGYEEKVEYKDPAGGKKPATATMTISGDSLMWKTTSGEISGGLPKEIKLMRDKMNKVSEE